MSTAALPPPTAASDEEKSASSNQLNAPNISPTSGKPQNRAVSSAKQAYNIAKSLRDRAIDGRLRTAALIGKAYDGESPFISKLLERAGQGWRNNFSTLFLASIIDRIVPQITEPLEAADLLCHKALPADHPDGVRKSRTFNEVATKTIRAWPEWKDFISGLGQEVIKYGNAVATRLGDDWRPRMWRYDEAYLPEGTGQHADNVQVGGFRQTMLMHDFMDLFRDKEAATRAGYNYEGCIKTANTAGGFKNTEESPMERQDAVREQATMEYSYATENQTRQVRLFHVPVRDYTGDIDLWTVSEDDGTEIRQVKGAHKQMRHCMTLFTMQVGNRKFYGSKGLGRMLTNLHTSIERGRNYTADKVQFSGFPVVKSDDPAAMQLQLRYPFMVAPKDAEVLVEEFHINWEAAEGLDGKLAGIAESIAGAFIPPNIDQSGSSKTKIEAAQKAERDLAVRKGVLGRFANQSRDLVDMMVIGMFSPLVLREGKRAYEEKKRKQANKVIVVLKAAWQLLKAAFGQAPGVEPLTEVQLADEAAVAAVVQLLEAGLTMEEIAMLAVSPSGENNENEGAAKDNQTLQYIAANKQNPYVDQEKASRMEARLVLGPARANELLIPQEDPSIRDKAIRDQTIELGEMLDGRAMPVVKTDNHSIHRQTLAPQLEALVQQITQAPTPEIITAVKLGLVHYDQHLGMDSMVPPEQAAEERKVIKGWWDTAAKYEELLAKATAAVMATGGPTAPGNGPALNPNGGPTAQGNGADPNGELKTAAELALETKRVSQKDRELTLAEDQHAHQVEKDAAELQQENIRIMQAAAEKARAEGLADANADLADTATKV